MADTPTPPAYPGVYWIWHKNLPVSGTGHPTPGFWNLAHLSQVKKCCQFILCFLHWYFCTSGLKISKVDTLALKT